jgi:hypothetical protein
MLAKLVVGASPISGTTTYADKPCILLRVLSRRRVSVSGGRHHEWDIGLPLTMITGQVAVADLDIETGEPLAEAEI